MAKHFEVPVFATQDEFFQFAKVNRLTVLSRKTPGISAEKFMHAHRQNIISHQESWLDYDGSAYREVENDAIKSQIEGFCDYAYTMAVGKMQDGTDGWTALPFHPFPYDIKNIRDMLWAKVHKPRDTMAPPCWLDGGTGPHAGLDPRKMISMRNGILDTTTRKLYPATPKFFTLSALAIDYDKSAPSPERFLQFLVEVTDDRPELAAILQERTGYILSGDTMLQVIFMMIGPPRSGKGTMMNVTEALIGKEYTGSCTVTELASTFERDDLIAARYQKVTDLDATDKKELARAGNFMNRVSGNDTVTIGRKFKSKWKGKLATIMEMACNTVPDFGDNAPAMISRVIAFPFSVSFLGREQRDLEEVLLCELPGILNWALDGLDRLREQKGFIEPPCCIEAKRKLIHQSNPLAGLVADWCELGTGKYVDKRTLYDAFIEYCEAIDIVPIEYAPFCKALIEQFKVAPRRPWKGGERNQEFAGIGLKLEHIVRMHRHDANLIELMSPGIDTLLTDADGCYIRDQRDHSDTLH